MVEGRLDAPQYINLIAKTLKDDGERIIGTDFIFQQDGATCHTAKDFMNWLSANRISVLPWPSQSAN